MIRPEERGDEVIAAAQVHAEALRPYKPTGLATFFTVGLAIESMGFMDGWI